MKKRISGAKTKRRSAKPGSKPRLRKQAAKREPTATLPIREVMLNFAVEQPESLFLKAFGPVNHPAQPKRECPAHQWPQNFSVRLSGRCNLACDYCFDSANCAPLDQLDRPTARHIADYILAVPVTKPLISFLGGEPLLNWFVGKFLIDEIRRKAGALGKDPYFSIVTNGTPINEVLAKELVAPDISVQISIDGLQTGHDLHRRYPDGGGSYQAALNGLRRLRAVSEDAKVDAQVVLSPGNIDMIAIAQELKSLGFRRINFLYLTAGANGHSPWSAADVLALMEERKKFYLYFVQSAIAGSPEVDMSFAALVSSQPDGPIGLCGCGWRELYIDAHGDIYPCPKLYGKAEVPSLGNCATMDAKAALPIREAVPADDECAQCWAFSWCGGGCSFQCQKCSLLPSSGSDLTQILWCDLMRAQFARAAVTYYWLQCFHPESWRAIRAIFAGGNA